MCSPGCPAPTRARGALMVHGHLDVVPAEAADWSVHPFSGAVEDGYVWGRGAIDMKDMVGMMHRGRPALQTRRASCRPATWCSRSSSDEEAGGKYGCKWLVENRPDLFDGVTEAIGEVGGFSLTVPRRDGGERRLYLIETAEKGMLLDAADRARAAPATGRSCTTTTPSPRSPRPSRGWAAISSRSC